MLKRRLVYNGLDRKALFEELWRMIAISLVDGEESSEYLIERSMMRPRFLLNLLSHCRGYAINLGHDKIQADDIRRGLDAFSTDLIYDIDLEIRDVLPFALACRFLIRLRLLRTAPGLVAPGTLVRLMLSGCSPGKTVKLERARSSNRGVRGERAWGRCCK